MHGTSRLPWDRYCEKEEKEGSVKEESEPQEGPGGEGPEEVESGNASTRNPEVEESKRSERFGRVCPVETSEGMRRSTTEG